ncbi:MAG: hypothetical protein FWD50_07610 [Betaproteobacteria bacterium]|nr:hypothetical protein [Betaproteobacteria bacterium]
MKPKRPTVADLASFDEIIDVRSPAEFAEDLKSDALGAADDPRAGDP